MRAKRLEERDILTERLLQLLERLRSRLDEDTYRWAEENAGQTEWELAIDAIRVAEADGNLTLSADEQRELSEIERSRLLAHRSLPTQARRDGGGR
jgi:hypothetical protein